MLHKSLPKIIFFTLFSFAQVFSDSPPIMGLIGGSETIPGGISQYAATISPQGLVTPLNLGNGSIDSVALNQSGLGLIGGNTTNGGSRTYIAFVSADQGLQQVPFTIPESPVNPIKVAINEGGLGLIGGRTSQGEGFTAFVTPNSATQIPLPTLSPQGIVRTVALNNANVGIVGGIKSPFSGQAFAALVFSNTGTAQEIALGIPDGSIGEVSINDSGLALIGGNQSTIFEPYAAFVANGIAVPISLPSNVDSPIRVTSLNESNIGLIATTGFAAFVSLNQPMQVISGIADDTFILDGKINALGYGLIGGQDDLQNMYATFITPNRVLQPILGLPAGSISSVALNQFNQGLLGGNNFQTNSTYAAIVSPSGVLTPLNLGFSTGLINSVAINAFFVSQIPTQGLTGNNLRFAEYINAYVPQNVFYFVPAMLENSLTNALESAAPTRNAISFNTLLQNAFYFTTALSTHLRDQSNIHARAPINTSNRSTAQRDPVEETDEELLAGRCFPSTKKERRTKKMCSLKPDSNTVWIEAVGALAYQGSQHQTPAFNPSSGGAILGFDRQVSEEFIVGGGGTYVYTHIHEKQDAGTAHINQEDLFLYGSWNPKHFYLDIGLWGGLFQTHQDRHIHMPGFSFHSVSKPKGWQLVPHLELGWIGHITCTQNSEVTWNLLGMLDWANAWQRKYQEKGSGPFNVQQNSHHGSLLRTEAGLRFSETLFYSTWNLIFQEKGSYVNVQSFNAGKVHAFIVGSPGAFTVETLNNAQNLGVVQFLISAASYKKWHPTGTLFYQGEFGSKYQSHQLGLEFAMSF